MMKTFCLTLLPVALLGALLGACGGPPAGAPGSEAAPGSTAAGGSPEDGDWIIIHLGAEPATLNPFLEAAGAYTVRVVFGNGGNVYETLLMRDNETLELQPHLAESYEVSENRLTYTFKLRKEARWSDGEALTAHDVKFTFDSVRDPANDTPDVRGYLNDFESAEVVDDQTIVFHAKQPYFLHLTVLGTFLYILPKHIFETGDFNTHAANREPIGSGAYRFESWTTNQQIVLAKRDDYWGAKKPHVDKLVFKIITDDNAAFLELERGGLDEMRMNSEQWVNRASNPAFEEKFNKFKFWSPVDGYVGIVGWIGWNMKRPQFADKRVRQAMTLLLDRQTILDTLFYGMGRVVTGIEFPDNPEYDSSIQPWPFDPQRARQLLDEAGWVDSDGDGIRDKDGVAFKVEWIFPSGQPQFERLATVFKEQLDKAGVSFTLRPLEWASYLESVYKRNFDVCAMSWVSEVESDPYQIWHSSQAEKGSNYVGFINAEADTLMEDARLEFDRDKRVALYHRLHGILHDEQPYTFLYNSERKVAVAKRFRDVIPYAQGFDARDWWVPKSEQRYK